ncbi:MAG: adenine deaminase [Firmicutes bacterium HGW-Firmicutes-14]|nr:MAG: adenine deaminase [Firmicutes bacterium HGW-Firmicutes-14]
MLTEDFLSAAKGERTADLALRNARVINVFSGEILETDIAIYKGHIAGFGDYDAHMEHDLEGRYAAPGFIDSHIHIESSMLLPHNFGRVVIRWGTTTVVTDPHEIANVLGIDGIRLMQASAELGPVDVRIMVPSCVPATDMETAGAQLGAAEIERLLKETGIIGLAEMMNFPGVVNRFPDVLEKIRAAWGRPIDGHAPGLVGKDLNTYVAAGISSDHECTSLEEACAKLRAGMYIMIREGSTAKNLETLLPAVNERNASRFMLVTDDANPEDLLHGHLNLTLKKAVALGLDPVTALRMVTINPAQYFGFRTAGALGPGYQADVVVLDDLTEFKPYRVYKKGTVVAREGIPVKDWPLKNFPVMTSMNVTLPEEPFKIKARKDNVKVIGIIPGQIVTRNLSETPKIIDGNAVSDIDKDLLKVAVVERHTGSGNVGLGFVHGFGLKKGALASSVAHDSHNIIVVGTDDHDMEKAVQEIINMGGGLTVVGEGRVLARLPLPVAGLMSADEVNTVLKGINELKKEARALGCILDEPFMALSFLSLPVIPDLKLTDKGLVDVGKFKFVPLFGKD